LFLTELSVVNFKNIADAQLKFDPGFNCLTGLNGMGKTNCLDAIFMACVGKNHFNLTDQQLIKQGFEFCRIEADFHHDGIKNSVIIKLPSVGKKTISLDSKPYRKIADHLGRFPIVMIAPNDVEIVTGSGEVRRKFLDTTLCQIDTQYLDNLVAYNKILKQRNAYLKMISTSANADFNLLEAYDAQLSCHGHIIHEKRAQYISELCELFVLKYSAITSGSEKVHISYHSQLTEKPMLTQLQESRRKDQILERTSCGIHKDDLMILLEDREARKFASQGQSKSLLFALKFAEYQLISNKSAKLPILLLDDIFDKLDDIRVLNLMSVLKNGIFGQVFITDTSLPRLENILKEVFEKYFSFNVENGEIQPINHEKT